MSMGSPFKVTVTGDPTAPIKVPESRNVNK